MPIQFPNPTSVCARANNPFPQNRTHGVFAPFAPSRTRLPRTFVCTTHRTLGRHMALSSFVRGRRLDISALYQSPALHKTLPTLAAERLALRAAFPGSPPLEQPEGATRGRYSPSTRGRSYFCSRSAKIGSTSRSLLVISFSPRSRG